MSRVLKRHIWINKDPFLYVHFNDPDEYRMFSVFVVDDSIVQTIDNIDSLDLNFF